MKTFFEILNLYKGYKKSFIFALIATVMSITTEFAYPILTKYIIDSLIYEQNVYEAKKQLIWIGLGFIGTILIDIMVSRLRTVNMSYMIDDITKEIKDKIFKHAMTLDFTYYDNHNVGDLVSLFERDIDHLSHLLFHLPEKILETPIAIIIAIIVFSGMSFPLVVATFPIVFFFAIANYITKIRYREYKKEERLAEREYTEFVEDTLTGIRAIKSFGAEQIVSGNAENITMNVRNISHRKWRVLSVCEYIDSTFDDVYYGIMLVIGALMTMTGVIDATDMITFFMYAYLIANPMQSLGAILKEYQDGVVSFQRIRDFLKEEPIIKNTNCYKGSLKETITFNDVSFHYDGIKAPVFNHINLQINPGEYVAICGESGLGKTTLVSLLTRYYEVKSGSIQIGSVDVRDFDLKYLRQNIGIVQQDVYLFSGTVAENIMLGVETAPMNNVILASKMANAHEFIMNLPNGYDSKVGERGVKLSGGQKQRIAIARLFLTKPPIIIFDEVTSSLDTESERKVQEALERLSEGRTTIVIAHRLTTIRNAKRILVLTKNGIAEEGTHEELIAKEGEYAKLYNGKNFREGFI